MIEPHKTDTLRDGRIAMAGKTVHVNLPRGIVPKDHKDLLHKFPDLHTTLLLDFGCYTDRTLCSIFVGIFRPSGVRRMCLCVCAQTETNNYNYETTE